ncbi:MAG: GntR family transcriptional regulator [Afipia sp.]|nr:GntR family transcriptional regulator [Afipia sp.]
MAGKKKTQRAIRGSGTPLYVQISEKIRYQIVSGVYAPEAQLPSEAELMRMFGVSRVTIRQALADLEQTGFIYKQQGVGTFVSGSRVLQQFSRGAQTIVEALRRQGIEPTIKVIDLRHVKPDAEVAEALGTTDEVVKLTRTFNNGSIPVAEATLYLPMSMSGVAHLLAKNVDHQTTYTLLEGPMGLVIKEAKHIIRTVSLDKGSAKNLHMHVGDVCLGMTRITFSNQGVPLEFTRLIYPPDRMRFEFTLPRTSGSQMLTMVSEAAE